MPDLPQQFSDTLVAQANTTGNFLGVLVFLILYRALSLTTTFIKRSNCYKKKKHRRTKRDTSSDSE